jgi:hypothetical protein
VNALRSAAGELWLVAVVLDVSERKRGEALADGQRRALQMVVLIAEEGLQRSCMNPLQPSCCRRAFD